MNRIALGKRWCYKKTAQFAFLFYESLPGANISGIAPYAIDKLRKQH